MVVSLAVHLAVQRVALSVRSWVEKRVEQRAGWWVGKRDEKMVALMAG